MCTKICVIYYVKERHVVRKAWALAMVFPLYRDSERVKMANPI